jgi:hypothetical protein
MKNRFKWLGMSEDGSTITLRRFDGSFPHPSEPPSGRDNLCKGLVLDTETTGMEPGRECVIEIGLRGFWFDKSTREIVAIEPGYSALQDPGRPLRRGRRTAGRAAAGARTPRAAGDRCLGGNTSPSRPGRGEGRSRQDTRGEGKGGGAVYPFSAKNNSLSERGPGGRSP